MSSDTNIRTKAINLLKLSSSAFIDGYKRKHQKHAISKSKVYLEELTSVLTSREYVDSVEKHDVRPTKLRASDFFKRRDCAGSFDISCRKNEPTNKDIKNLVGILEDKNIKSNSIQDESMSIKIDDENMNYSFSDPVKCTDETILNTPKTRRYSDVDKSTQKPLWSQKPSINSPFKRTKLDPPANGAPVSIKNDSIDNEPEQKQQSLKFTPSFEREYQLSIYETHKSGDFIAQHCRPSKSKMSNPWKEERMSSKQQASPSNQFDDCKNPRKSISKQEDQTAAKSNPFASFRTGKQELEWQKNLQKKPPLRGLSKKRQMYVNINEQIANSDTDPLRKKFACPSYPKAEAANKKRDDDEDELTEDLKGFDKEILKRIQREIVIDSKNVNWDDIIGLEGAKKVIKESVILAIRRPDLFTGLRESSRAIMLFGPPGTGKTLIGKCIASSCDATFMSVSASSLTSKWIGESETLVRAMFTYAKIKQPCVIFFDEIDSLLEKRSEQGNETFNRIKTEFLVQLDGANALKETDKVLLIGATNRPDVIDEAILRRFTKRILVPLPVKEARVNMIKHLLSKQRHTLTENQIEKLSDVCDKYSGSDISQVCKEAAMMSIRGMDSSTLESMKVDDIPPISPKDFLKALRNVKPTVSQETISKLDEWNQKYGSTVDTNNGTMDLDESDFFDDDF